MLFHLNQSAVFEPKKLTEVLGSKKEKSHHGASTLALNQYISATIAAI